LEAERENLLNGSNVCRGEKINHLSSIANERVCEGKGGGERERALFMA